jgi:isocitrate/isopropylmalate dehydrogenase
MFAYSLEMKNAAEQVDQAISDCISFGECTPDLGGTLSTSEAGAAVRKRLAENMLSRAVND